MHTSDAGINLICEFEGCKLEAYLCPAKVWTIGYGHTGKDVHAGLTISQAKAVDLLRHDLKRFEEAVTRLTEGCDITQHQFDALVSFAFNLGEGTLKKSTLLKKFRAGDIAACPAEIERFNRAGGKILDGLVRRRRAEVALFQSI